MKIPKRPQRANFSLGESTIEMLAELVGNHPLADKSRNAISQSEVLRDLIDRAWSALPSAKRRELVARRKRDEK